MDDHAIIFSLVGELEYKIVSSLYTIGTQDNSLSKAIFFMEHRELCLSNLSLVSEPNYNTLFCDKHNLYHEIQATRTVNM